VTPETEPASTGGLLHHVELWVSDISAARPRWQWLLSSLGYEQFQLWDNGVSYQLGPTYIVLEQSPALIEGSYERRRAGLNHLAFAERRRKSIVRMRPACGGCARRPRAGRPSRRCRSVRRARPRAT